MNPFINRKNSYIFNLKTQVCCFFVKILRSPRSWRSASITSDRIWKSLSPSPSSPKNVHKFWRVPALGAAMAESAVSNFDRLSGAPRASLKFSTNALRTRGVFTCRVHSALDARWALWCDLATVLLKYKDDFLYILETLDWPFLKEDIFYDSFCLI